MKVTPESGFYKITVSLAAPQTSAVKLIGTSGAEVQHTAFTVIITDAGFTLCGKSGNIRDFCSVLNVMELSGNFAVCHRIMLLLMKH